MSIPLDTMRVLQPFAHVVAFYDGRVADRRLVGPETNWLDDGAYELGIATYAILDADEALVYDAHISLAHATFIRNWLQTRGYRRLTLVVSHWHDDHVAGNAVFVDCPIIANRQTAELLSSHRGALAAGNPPIDPLILPNRLIDEPTLFKVGSLDVQLLPADIHSEDGLIAHLPASGILLAGDTLEDPITYVAEPDRLAIHRANLQGLRPLAATHILPNHGAPEVIAAGGYEPGLIEATDRYLAALLAADLASRATLPLSHFAAEAFATGAIFPFAPYETVHRRNVEACLKARAATEAKHPG